MIRLFTPFFAIPILCLCSGVTASAQQKLCIKNRLKVSDKSNKTFIRTSKALRVVNESCPRGFSELLSTQSFQGPQGDPGSQGLQGPAGPSGSDANLEQLVYGDGSAGELNVSNGETVNTSDLKNLNFTNINIQAGGTLSAVRGKTIRCTGSLSNAGDINGLFTGSSVALTGGDANSIDSSFAAWKPNIFGSIAKSGEFSFSTGIANGGPGGNGITSDFSSTILNPRPDACGEGAPGNQLSGFCGSTVKIYCRGQIINTATGAIDSSAPSANAGSGGGSGGFIVLASQTGVINEGSITATGGNGGNSSTSIGSGGGGGGGIIHLIAPTVSGSGNTVVTGGSAGSNATSATTDPRRGGGGGGSLGGTGGSGGSVQLNNSVTAAGNGGAGHAIETELDPTNLLLQQLASY